MTEKKILEHIREIGSLLEMKENTILAAEKLAYRAEDKFLNSGKKIEGTAAAIIYISGILEGDRRTQKEIATSANVPESTIRNRYLELARSLELKKEK